MSRLGSPSRDIIFTKDDLNIFNKSSKQYFSQSRTCLKNWAPLFNEDSIRGKINESVNKRTYWISDKFMGQTTVSEDENSTIDVSESESISLEQECIKKTRKRFYQEDEDDEICVNPKRLSSNERNLETLWKLYRNAGETVEEFEHRLIDQLNEKASGNIRSPEKETDFKIKDAQYCIKQEITSDNSACESNEIEEEEKDRRDISVDINVEIIPSQSNEFIDYDSDGDYPLYCDDFLSIVMCESDDSIQLSNDPK